YNFRIRQEFEQHHGDQRIDNADERNGATFTNKDFFYDPGYTNWRTMFMFDSFLDNETYVTANYMYNYLNSNSTYSEYNNGSLIENARDTGNSRRTNVGSLGYRRANVLQKPGLDFTAALRVEDSKTDSGSTYFDGSTNRPFTSSLDEVRVAEVFRLVYKGIKKTTLSFDADLEQRDLDWDTQTDAGHASDVDRKTDTDFLDQVYTFKAVHRHNRALKSTVRFRIKDLERSMTNLYRAETDPTRFPGILGSYRRRGEDLTVKTDFRFNSKTSSTLMYQYIHEGIDFELGGKTSNQEIHRGLGSLSFSPRENLFLVGTFMLENYDIDTPATVASTSYGVIPSDFRGNSYSLLLDGTYAFNERTSATLGFRHTEALGTVDYAGDYVYDRASLMLKHKFAKNKTVGLGYQFYNFNSHDPGSFDDYRAHGAIVTYEFTF
ncbi:MAG: TonB-dependent receptor, partial [Planctomycetota bacterium]